MADRTKQRRRAKRDVTGTLDAIDHATYMIRVYGEILAMDEAILERVRKLLVGNSANRGREETLTNLRLFGLTQMIPTREIDRLRPLS